jgi:phage major head subunit gpT-like protein
MAAPITAQQILEILAAGARGEIDVPEGPYERLAAARGGYDNSALTERGILGIFFDSLEASFDRMWASRVGLLIPADAESQTHRWIGQTPKMREWLGGLLAKGLNDTGITIVNRDFEASMEISAHDHRRDKTGGIQRRVGELAAQANDHWCQLLIDVCLEGAPTAYDGLSLFHSAHTFGDMTAFDNDLEVGTIPALQVATAARPTREEASDILIQSTAHFFTAQDDKGSVANQGARQFLLLCPPAMGPGFLQAVRHDLGVTGGTQLTSGLGWTWEVVMEPRLASSTVAYLMRTDAPSSRPFILQSEVEPYVDVIAEGSEHAKKNNSHLYTVKATRYVGPGEFRQVLKLTLSA